MQQTTNRRLYQYWNGLRGTRLAPHRFEIEPARIAPLLAETFIVECAGRLSCRFRLAGTRICEHFGRELRGLDFLKLWQAQDRRKVHKLLTGGAVLEGAVAVIVFDGFGAEGRKVRFELVLLPLLHTGSKVTRLLGSVSALETPYWLGAAPLQRLEIVAVEARWPQAAETLAPTPAADEAFEMPDQMRSDLRRRFRILQGGLDEPTK